MSRPLRQRATYIGFISASEYFAIAIAPLIGGALTSSLSWRWCFYINLPPAAVAGVLLLLLKLPNSPSSHNPPKSHAQKLRDLDLLGFFFLAPGVLCLLLALQWGGATYSWDNARIIALFITAPIVLTIFCFIQHFKQNSAMLPPRILKKRTILAASLFTLSLSACSAIVQYYVSILISKLRSSGPDLTVSTLQLPIWFQTIQGVSPLQSGINTLPLVVSILVCAVLAGHIITLLGSYTPIMIPAALCVLAGISITTQFTTTSPAHLWIPALVLLGIGSGSGVSTPFIAAQTVLQDTSDVSVGLAFMTFSQDIGEAVFISIAQAIFLNRLTGNLKLTVPGLDPETIIQLGATSLERKIPAEDLSAVKESYNVAVKGTFYLAVALAGSMVVAGILISRSTLKASNGH